MKDYYGILDLPTNADSADIRKAFRALALMCHPDLAKPGEGDPATAFIEVREAYEVLIDPVSRAAYDQKLEEHRKKADAHTQATAKVPVERPPAKNAYSPSAASERLRKPVPAELIPNTSELRTGLDIYGSIEVDLEDTIRPGNYTVLLPGADSEGKKARKVLIRLPGKLFDGALLRVKYEGNSIGGLIGDLYIEVILKPHQYFTLRGEMLFTDVSIKPWDAALGCDARIPTLEGFMRVALPPCSKTPYVHRVTGMGLYNSAGERGDLWVTFKVEIPEPATVRERNLWSELAEEFRRSQR